MSVQCQQVGNSLVIRLSGELDLVAAADFKRLADEYLDHRRISSLYVNLEHVTFLDSSFLGALLGRYRRISQAGGRMGVIGVPGVVRPALEFSGVFRTMAEYPTEQVALSFR